MIIINPDQIYQRDQIYLKAWFTITSTDLITKFTWTKKFWPNESFL